MALLDHMFEACGGIARWRAVRRFTAHVSMNGDLLSRKCKVAALNDIVVEGSTREQALKIEAFTRRDRRVIYRPDRVIVQHGNGSMLMERLNPEPTFVAHTAAGIWDDLDLAYFCGFTLWNHMTVPFLFADPDCLVSEMPTLRGRQPRWRRFSVELPPRIVTHAREQVLYVDDRGRACRLDYDMPSIDGLKLTRLMRAPHEFSHFVVPTLQDSLQRRTDGSVIPKPALLRIEVFDATFE